MELPAGSNVGYGHTILNRNSTIAVLSVGYSDGYPATVRDSNNVVIAKVRN